MCHRPCLPGFKTEGLPPAVWRGGESEALDRLRKHLDKKVDAAFFPFVIQHILPSNDDGELVSIHRQEFQPAVILNVTSQAGLWDSHIHIGLIALLLMTM